MTSGHWHLRITIESSAKAQFEQLARDERRSVSNYVRILIENRLREEKPA